MTLMTLPPRHFAIGLCALAALQSANAQSKKAAAASPLAPLDAYVAKVMKEWKVPGIAIAIVKNDSLIFTKGYGVQKAGENTPVNDQTIFAIGSSSKAFTAALVAMAVDENKMRFDDPVSKYLPGFQLNDTYASHELTLRDALSHRSGLARGDFMWYVAGLPRDEILRRVRYLKPSWGFRALFGYQNLMFLAAGEAVAHAQGMSWDDQVRQRIFAPLGMTSSSTSITALAGRANVSSPHAEADSVVGAIPWKNIDNIAPAGSINSNVVDMSRWLRFQLNHGKVGDKQLLTEGNHYEMWTANTHIRLGSGLEGRFLAPGANLAAYGMGWFLQDFSGHLAVHHGGNIDGFSAMVAMMPDEKLGVVILTNKDGTPAPEILFPYVFDLYTRATPRDWSADYTKLLSGAYKAVAVAESALVKARVTGTSPSLALDKYAGTYSDSMYGDIRITVQDGKLHLAFGIMQATLEHWHYDTFRAIMQPARLGKVMSSFVLDANGKPSELKLEATPEAAFRFTPPKADTRAALVLSLDQLRALTGKFSVEGAPIEIDVQLVGDALRLTVPGQPAYTLVALTPARFRLAGPDMPDGFYIEYVMSAGQVTGATLEQPAPRPQLRLTKK